MKRSFATESPGRMFSRANQTRRDRRKRVNVSAAKPRLKTAQGVSPGTLSPKRHALKVRFNFAKDCGTNERHH